MSQIVCVKCGDLVPSFYVTQGLCDSCKWDTWIPKGYEKRERYRFDPAAGHHNRTCRPLLGIRFLDAGLRDIDLSAFYRVAEDDRKAFAARLLAEGFSQKEAALQTGVSPATLCRWTSETKKNFHAMKFPRHFRVGI